jgi:CelD/BcsL family acetyltransferase involved in cellulose biosynthesis
MSRSDEVVISEDFDSFSSYWVQSPCPSMWNCIFVLPPWLKAWWHEFGSYADLYLASVLRDGVFVGAAPLLLKDGEASFIGSADVCDYLDFIILPGMEVDFFTVLLDDLRDRGVGRLNLQLLRPDSTVLSCLLPLVQDLKYDCACEMEDVSSEVCLPPTWEEYLGMLTQKQRHEVRRKLKRLREAGDVNYRVIEDWDSISQSMALFLKLFRESRQDKATFLTTRMEHFLTALVRGMAQAGLARLGILELNASPVAAVLCFDYNNTVFLYNNGYDPRYTSLSVGSICKTLCIKDSIDKGRGKFDFLKGAEEYKHHMGGREVNLCVFRTSLGQ